MKTYSEFNKIYYKILLEEVLSNSEQQDNILPDRFNDLLINLKNAMLKAINATTEQLKDINQQVNYWRDKLVQEFLKFKNILTLQQQRYLNDIVLDLTTKYMQFMHGYNTGY